MTTIAIVGCGAIVEQAYLPALRDCRGIRCEMLVDPERARVEELAARYGVARSGASIDELPGSVEGVVVAVPNDLHLSMVTAAVRRGLHVLCEKPLARTRAEVAAMVAAAREAGRGLFAAMVCRRYPAVREVVTHRLTGLIGALQEVDAAYGTPLDWPVKSAAYYDKARSGGGGLLDLGAHLIDAMLYVTGDPAVDVLGYADDADGGVDAEADGRVALLLSHGRVDCHVRTSRLRRLPNAIVLRGASGTLEIPLTPLQSTTLRTGGGTWPVTGHLGSAMPCFVEQLEDFGRAIRGDAHDLPDGLTQAATIGLIEGLYTRREPLMFAWDA